MAPAVNVLGHALVIAVVVGFAFAGISNVIDQLRHPGRWAPRQEPEHRPPVIVIEIGGSSVTHNTTHHHHGAPAAPEVISGEVLDDLPAIPPTTRRMLP